MFTGEQVWCQLFSEPATGSDLASLTTHAPCTRRDEWLVNGQKVWNTLAHIADIGMLVTRTGGPSPSTRGSPLAVDVRAAGVEVRPLRPDHR